MQGATAVETTAMVTVKDTLGNPFPLAFAGVGMTLVLLSLANIGYYPLDSMILAMAIFCGGFGQFVAGIWAWKKNITFAATAFTMYGLFFLTLVGLIALPKFGIGAAPAPNAMGAFMAVWGVFTVLMFIGTLRICKSLQGIFGLLAVLYFLLAAANLTGNASIAVLAGWDGLATGALAIYFALGHVLNEVYGKELFPL